MKKPAATTYPIHELMVNRWSPRAFDARPVEREKLLSLLEAARWGASSMNEQPWSYLIATRENPAEFNKMVGCLVPANQIWARNAPVLMISVAKTIFTRNSTPNRVAIHDVGGASAQLAMQATHLGLFIHQMGGIDTEMVKSTYALPEHYEAVAGIAIGYPGDPSVLDTKLQERELAPRTRKQISEFAFGGVFGKPADFL